MSQASKCELDDDYYFDDVRNDKRQDKRRRIYRRVEHLERRIQDHKGDKGTQFDAAELSALKWILNREIELSKIESGINPTTKAEGEV